MSSALDLRCRICGGGEAILMAHQGKANYVQCLCGVTYAVPLPTLEELSTHYGENYMSREVGEHNLRLHFSEEYRATYQRERDLTFHDLGYDLREDRGKRLLDVGCADGIFLEYVRPYEFQAQGIDVSKEMVAIAVSRGYACSTMDILSLDGKFHVITLWDTIEHLSHPREVLEKAYALLEDGGDLILQTPCTGIISDTFGEHWRNYIYPDHLHLFSQEGLFRLLSSIGFSLVSWVRFGSGNGSGTIPDVPKRVFDNIAKKLGIGDEIAVWARKTRREQ